MSVTVGINGFGRIGRLFLRAVLARNADVDVVGINDLTDASTLAYLFKHDSSHGKWPGEVSATTGEVRIDGQSIRIFSERDPSALPWGEMGVNVVIEATGMFRDRDGASQHLAAGAETVSYTHLRAHETDSYLVCRLLLEKKKK